MQRHLQIPTAFVGKTAFFFFPHMRRTAREIPVKVSTPEKWLHARIFTSYQKARHLYGYREFCWISNCQRCEQLLSQQILADDDAKKGERSDFHWKTSIVFARLPVSAHCVLNLIFIPYRRKPNLNFTPILLDWYLNFVHMLSAVSLCDQMSSVLRHV